MTEKQQQKAGRIGGLSKSSRYDPQTLTGKARQSFLARFERDVDPEGILEPLERQRRAEAARRAYMSRLAMKGAETRRKRKSGRKT